LSMMQIFGVAIISAAAVAIVKIYRPEYVFPMAAVSSTALLGAALTAALPVAEYASTISSAAGFGAYFGAIMKALGIGLVAELAASVCRDSGQATLASRVEFFAKVLMMTVALPIIKQIIDAALEVVK